MFALCVGGLAAAVAVLVPIIRAEEAARASRGETPDDKRWQAVAPGRVEPLSGEVKIAASIIGVVGEVLVKANDKVFAGEPLVRLIDSEAQARLATAEAQIALRRRARNDESPSSRASPAQGRSRVADAERRWWTRKTRAWIRRPSKARRRGSDTDVDAARAALCARRIA